MSLHRYIYDIASPLYDFGFWCLALIVGGETALRRSVIEALEPLEGKRCLELFAGTATLSLLASRAGAEAYAADISSGMLEVAAVKSAAARQNLRLVRADGATLPFADASFDRVFVSMGLHEADPASLGSIFSEASRVLKSRATFVIFDYHAAEAGAGFFQKLVFAFTEGDNARRWLATDIQDALHSAGFTGFRRTFLKRRVFQCISVVKK